MAVNVDCFENSGTKVSEQKGVAMTITSVRRSVYLSITVTAAFLFLSVWAMKLVGIDLGAMLLKEPVNLKNQQWFGLSLAQVLVGLKIVCFIVSGYVLGTWFFSLVVQSKWAVAVFVAMLSMVDIDFAFIFVASLGALIGLYLWMEGLPPFEIPNKVNGHYVNCADDDFECSSEHKWLTSDEINPATGLTMPFGGIDSAGNPNGSSD